MATREEIAVLGLENKEGKHRSYEAKQRAAMQEFRLKIGDGVKICGYSHYGKAMVIDSISAPALSIWGEWEVKGAVLTARY